MTTTTASQARQQFFALLQRVQHEHEPIEITSKRGNVVMISESDYRAIQETMHLLSIPGMREKLIEGKNTPLGETISAEEIWPGISASPKRQKKTRKN